MECEDFASSLAEKKKPLVEGRTRSGQVFLRTIGHLFLGNFRGRLARVYVKLVGQGPSKKVYSDVLLEAAPVKYMSK